MNPSDPTLLSTRCTFSNDATDQFSIDLSSAVSDIPFQLRKEVPQEHIVRMFQKMVCISQTLQTPLQVNYIHQNVQYIIFSDRGHLTGLVTKSNIVRLLAPKLMDEDDLHMQQERLNKLLSR